MIVLSSITGTIIFIVAVLKVALGNNDTEKVIDHKKESEYELLQYNSVNGSYTVK